MPSQQVSLVIKTEKEAETLEQNARIEAQGIQDAAKETAVSNRRKADNATDGIIEKIYTDAKSQGDSIQKAEDLTAAELISSLHSTVGKRREEAIKDAVDLLTGKV